MRIVITLATFFLLGITPVAFAEGGTGFPAELPVKGMVTMVDLGADQCVPCKMMAPIIEEVRKEYKGKAAIVFIDVWKCREEAQKYGIRAIPTQIFYDKEGKEAFRHVGFFDKQNVLQVLKKLGVE